jgi:hypothetical protein
VSVAAVEWALPAALWGLTAAVPVAALHLYLRRRRRVLVPFAPLLVETLGAVRGRARFRRLREGASLLARLLALGCAVLALAGPRPARAGAPPRALVVVLDAGVTSAAREADGALRLVHARRLARAWVEAQPRVPGEAERLLRPAAVLAAGTAPRVLAPPTRDLARLRARLAATLAPSATRADLGAALRAAYETAAAHVPAQVVLLSSRACKTPAPPAGVQVLVQGTGSARDDQGLVDVSLERPAGSDDVHLRVRVRNDADAARRRDLVVRVAGREAARRTLELQAGGRREVSVRLTAPLEAAWLEAGLEGRDDFPADDEVQARLAPRKRPSLLVVHGGHVRPYTAALVRALLDEGWIDGSRGGTVRAADAADAVAGVDVVLVDGVALPKEALRPGAYVFLAPLRGALPFELGPTLEKPLLWRTARGHPLVRDLDFRRAYALQGQALAGPGLVPVAWADGRPVIAEGQHEGVRYVAFGLDPEGSALPTQADLPLLVRNAVLRLARAPLAPLAPFYRTGAALRPLVPLPGGPEVEVAWSGPSRDASLAATARGTATARVAPDGPAWHVPPGASGRVRVRTGGAQPWTGRTAFLDLDPARTIVPARPEGDAPAPARPPPPTAARWRAGLVGLAVLCLLLDLLLVAAARRRAATRA